MSDLFETLPSSADQLHTCISQATQQVRDFIRRLELILSQNHKNIPIRDKSFAEDFTTFCTTLRQQVDQFLNDWQPLREQVRRQLSAKEYPSSLQAKSFAMRVKTISRSDDEFTTVYDSFVGLYKSYTLSKLPMWILTSCCEDLNHLVGKILFLSREITKYAGKTSGGKHAAQ